MTTLFRPLVRLVRHGQTTHLVSSAPGAQFTAAPDQAARHAVPRFSEPEMQFRKQGILLFAGIGATVILFLSLPYTQQLSGSGRTHRILQSIDLSRPPPPPPPPIEPPPKKEQQQEEVKPDLEQEIPKMTLSQLETALNPGTGGAAVGDFSLNLSALAAEDLTRVFELTEIDRVPQAIVQVAPVYPFSLSRAGIEGKVDILFIVTPQGTVRDPRVLASTRVEFERPALEAVVKWRFEPGVKNGVKVPVRMQLPFAFNIRDNM